MYSTGRGSKPPPLLILLLSSSYSFFLYFLIAEPIMLRASVRSPPSKLKTSSTFLRLSVPVADHTMSKVTNKKGNAVQDVTLELTNPYSLTNRTLRFGQSL